MVNLETMHAALPGDAGAGAGALIPGLCDGAAASLITASEQGFALDSFKAVMVPETRG